jgi:hypothetical protein
LQGSDTVIVSRAINGFIFKVFAAAYKLAREIEASGFVKKLYEK